MLSIAFQMRLGGFSFRPALIPSAITFGLLPVLLALGFWQLDRAHQKEALLEVFKAQTALPYLPVGKLDLSEPTSLYRKVIATGRYDLDHQILLDNQVLDGRPGYHVYTPLRLTGDGEVVLVNRGWVPLGASRQQLPDIGLASAAVSLKGMVAQPANPGLRLPASATDASWPKVVQYLDYRELAGQLGYRLLPAVILLAPDQANGYRREWQAHFAGFGPERHRGYAFQWFALTLTLVVLYVVANTQRLRSEDV